MEVPHYGSLGRRLLAAFLDCLVLVIPCVIAEQVIPILGSLVVWAFYGPMMESSELRATPGKYWVGIQVADIQGRRISIQSALLRNVFKLFSPVLLFLGCLTALFTEKKQTLHDLIAGTIVVYGRVEQSMWTAWAENVRAIFGSARAPASTITELERLQKLKESGVLTEDEFQAQKRVILARTQA